MLNLSDTKISTSRLVEGTFWALVPQPDGSLVGEFLEKPHESKAWVRVVTPNIEYRRALMKGQAPYLKEIREATLSDELNHRIKGEALLVLLKDWGNIGVDGKLVDFGIDAARKLLTDRVWVNFHDVIDAIANNRKALLEATLEDSEGN